MILVSACLLGENCKYSGGNNYCQEVIDYLKDKEYLPICPETAGGLSIPRPPCEIYENRVFNKEGLDQTEAFIAGAHKCLYTAQKYQASECILKESSPSCGVNLIYDGTFSGKKIAGKGITAQLLEDNGFKIKCEDDFK